MGDKHQKITALALTFSIAALALSVYASLGLWKIKGGAAALGDVGDADFNARVEKGIEAYVQKQQDDANTNAPRVASAVDSNIADDDAVMGKKDAPITLVEFSDYECPFCGRFFEQTYGQIKANYLDKGTVKLVYRDYPLPFHPNARPAALAAECARKQKGDEGYFKYHDLIFQNQSSLSVENLKKYANDIGLNQSKFTACFDNKEPDAEITKDMEDGKKAGVTGTPGFILLMAKNEAKAAQLKEMELIQQGQYVIQYIDSEDGKQMGLRISGAHPYSTFERAFQIGL